MLRGDEIIYVRVRQGKPRVHEARRKWVRHMDACGYWCDQTVCGRDIGAVRIVERPEPGQGCGHCYNKRVWEEKRQEARGEETLESVG